MAISKVTLNGTVLMDVTQDTVVANKLMKNETAHKADGTQITGSYVAPTYTSQAKTGIVPTESSQTITPDSGYDGLSSVQINAISSTYVGSGIARRDSTSLTASGATVSVPAGYYASAASKAIASGSATTPATTITSAPTISVNASGVVTASNSKTQNVTPTVSAGYVSAGTSGTITVSGSNTYELSTQAAKTVTPTESTQTAVAAGKYTTGAVTVGAISSTYIGSDIPRRGASDITDSGPFVTVPAGYYDMQYSQSVGFIAHADPSVAINSSTGLVTASHYQHYGYIESTGTTTKTLQLSTQGATTVTPSETAQTAVAAGKYTTGAVTVGAISSTYVGSDIDRLDSTDLTASGATVTVPAGYYEEEASKAIASGSATTPATTVTANPSISVNSTTGLITATASATKSVTPTVSAGYVSSGTAGTITVSGSNTSQLSVQAAATITPSETAQTAVAAGKYTTGAVTVGAISSTYVGSGITRRTSSSMTRTDNKVYAPAGYYASQASLSVPLGTVYTPATTLSVSIDMDRTDPDDPSEWVDNTGTIAIWVQGGANVRPNVTTAGFISSSKGTRNSGVVNVQQGKSFTLPHIAGGTVTLTSATQTVVSGKQWLLGDIVVDATSLYDNGDTEAYGFNYNPSNLVGTGTVNAMII